MSYAVNNLSTANGYTTANTLDGLPPCAKINLNVSNAAIMFQLRSAIDVVGSGNRDPGTWGPDVQMIPGSLSLVRKNMTGIKVRSAVAGSPAVVSIEAVPYNEAA